MSAVRLFDPGGSSSSDREQTVRTGYESRFSRRFDSYSIAQAPKNGWPAVRVYGVYKPKSRKVQPVDSSYSTGETPGGLVDWRRTIELQDKEIPKVEGKYSEWLIPKFSEIERGSRLTPDRIEGMLIGSMLTEQERDLLFTMLHNREAALAWDFTHMGRVKEEVAPPQVIRTIEHKAWQAQSFAIPKALIPTVVGMLRERLQNKTLEYCDGAYRNPWFLVKKKTPGDYRVVVAAMEMNKVTIRDANLPPNPDEFAEHFAGCQIASLVDFFSGFDQVALDKKCRDMTAFMTPIGLLRNTTLPQGGTNSVAQFVRIVTKILEELMPHICLPFMDDIGVKGPRTTYGNKEDSPGIRRFVRLHIQWLDAVLATLERAGCTLSGAKSQWCMNGIKVVGYICGADGRRPESSKVIKIVEWPTPTSTSAARAFLGICVYYRIWISHFSAIAAPIYALFRKGTVFSWTYECQESMDQLKLALTSAPALIALDYTPGAGTIILAVDASLYGWGAVLMQLDAGKKRHPCRYESGQWNAAEQSYDATKRECRGILKALKKFRYFLYGIRFLLETDANVLVAQLNGAASDLPGSLLTRWIAWIRLFDFDIKHVPGNKHTAADGLSRRPRTKSDDRDELEEQDIEDFIDAQLYSVRIAPISVAEEDDDTSQDISSEEQDNENEVLEGTYSVRFQEYAQWLVKLQRPPAMSTKEFLKFKT